MVESVGYVDELVQQINILKLAYGNYLNLKKTLSSFKPQNKGETNEDYDRRLGRELDEDKNEFIAQTVSTFSNAATFVMFEVESLKENLPKQDVDDLLESYKTIEITARPSIADCKKLVQAANNLKVKLANTQNVMNPLDKLKNLSQTPTK